MSGIQADTDGKGKNRLGGAIVSSQCLPGPLLTSAHSLPVATCGKVALDRPPAQLAP